MSQMRYSFWTIEHRLVCIHTYFIVSSPKGLFRNNHASREIDHSSNHVFAGVKKCLSLSPVKLIPSCTVNQPKVLTQPVELC